MCCWVLSTGHDSITELYDFRHLNYCLRVITLIRQQNQEVENVWNQQICIAKQTEKCIFLIFFWKNLSIK